MRIIQALLSVLVFAGVSNAQVGYFIHGIDGRDITQPANVVVDIVLNGNCFLTGINYKQISSQFSIQPSPYDMQVRFSNGSCGGPILVTRRFDVPVGENFTIVMHLNEQGVPVLTKYTNDLRTTEGTRARLSLRHSAGIEPIQVRLKRIGTSSSLTFGGYLPILGNGQQQSVDLVSGKYATSLYSTVGYRRKTVTSEVTLADKKFVAVYAIGATRNSTFTLLIQTLDINK